jgi:sterol desaturase/sphingolipid hydroxylase (fatty acid hydroxylase superfamily)
MRSSMIYLRFVGYIALGSITALFFEYAWHAWIGHGHRGLVSRDSHLEHHRTAYVRAEPVEEMRRNIGLIGKALAAVSAVLVLLLGPFWAIPSTLGIVAAYVFTTFYHAHMHQRAPRTRYERWMWRFHFHHHYANPRKNFGLTSPLFDMLFGTAEVPDEVVVPAKVAPVWLTGECPGFRVRPSSGRVRL